MKIAVDMQMDQLQFVKEPDLSGCARSVSSLVKSLMTAPKPFRP